LGGGNATVKPLMEAPDYLKAWLIVKKSILVGLRGFGAQK